jgi:uncharacterized protein (DUF433 family)
MGRRAAPPDDRLRVLRRPVSINRRNTLRYSALRADRAAPDAGKKVSGVGAWLWRNERLLDDMVPRPCYVWPVMNTLLNRIVIDPKVCGGKPCVRGTRIWVSLILDLLADGMAEAELLAEYPQLAHEDVLAAIAYGAEAARERIIPVPTDRVA